MAHTSPAVNVVWAILAVLLWCFVIFHLWSFDRFRCLRWNRGQPSGAFRRVMTYSYLATTPFFIVFSVGFTIIKYHHGFTFVPGLGVIPTPYQSWSRAAQNATFPLYLSVSVGWALEMVTHLEELCFWFFLIKSNSTQQDWFKSLYFKAWALGSCTVVLVMPLVTILTRHDVYKCEAITYLTGGLASFALTISFLPILWSFPSFLEKLKRDDIETVTLARLTKYHELNCIRIVFRFIFTISIIILSVDGIRPHHHVNDNLFAADFLGILAGIGCTVSSGITLVIFFPRSIEGEMALKEQQRARRRQRAHQRLVRQWSRSHRPSPSSHGLVRAESDVRSYISVTHQSKHGLEQEDAIEAKNTVSVSLAALGGGLLAYEVALRDLPAEEHGYYGCHGVGGSISLKPNRRTDAGDVELGAVLTTSEVDLARARSKRERERSVSGLVHDWRSPIEIGRPVVSRWQRRV